jgi:phytanoyl-CoA dioxygenase PhyH
VEDNEIKAYIKQFNETGGVLFKNLISKEEIAELRNSCDEYFSSGETHMGTKDFLKIPKLAALPFHDNITNAIKAVFGDDYITVNQFVVGANLHNSKWHRDSDNQGNKEYLFDSDYQVAKCGVYLQDNDPEWCGGLEVIPGSHKASILGHRTPISRAHMKNNISRIQLKAIDIRDRFLNRVWLPIKAGDVFLFHANLIHRASQPLSDTLKKNRGGYKNVQFVDPLPPAEKFKYLIDWEVSPNNHYLPTYIKHQLSRSDEKDSSKLFVESAMSKFPENYPEWLVDKIKKNNINLVNYSDYKTDNI